MNKKIKKLAWTDEMTAVIRDNHLILSSAGIAKLINDKFGGSKSKEAIHKRASNCGYPINNKLPDSL